MYVTYDYYSNTYRGDIDSEDIFSILEKKAEIEINYYTRMRIGFLKDDDERLEKVRYCMCLLIDILNNYEQQKQRINTYDDKIATGQIVASESLGKQSVSYQNLVRRTSLELKNEMDKEIHDCIIKCLSMTGLTYGGLKVVY